MNGNRVFWVVLDSFGIGAAPDAADFGDAGANTLASIAATGRLTKTRLVLCVPEITRALEANMWTKTNWL